MYGPKILLRVGIKISYFLRPFEGSQFSFSLDIIVFNYFYRHINLDNYFGFKFTTIPILLLIKRS